MTGNTIVRRWLMVMASIMVMPEGKDQNCINTPGTAGGPGGRDQTLAVRSRKTDEKSFFFVKK